MIDVRRNKMKGIPKKLAVAGLSALTAVSGCDRDLSKYFHKTGNVDSYEVAVSLNGSGRKVAMWDGDNHISAKDFNNDGRFDEIFLGRLPKGHSLEKYATLDELEKVYSQVANQ